MGLCSSSGKSRSKVSPIPGTLKTNYEILQRLQLLNLKRYQFSELKEATSGFSPDNDLGPHVHGFKGWIHGKDVFVEAIRPKEGQGKHKLWGKMEHRQQLCHPNIMKLIGFSLEDEKWVLVYEFVSGSLNDYLGGIGGEFPAVSWSVCMKAALGVAKGLAFLHNEAQLMYEDFKTCDVLLDSKGNAKLSDFGLIKERPGTGCHENFYHARFLGTPGYAAPEYIATGALTAKCNVFSYGIILLEILSGKSATRVERPCEDDENAEEWARNLVKDSPILNQVILEKHLESNVQKVAQLAFKCVSMDPMLRPNMNDVVQVLEQLHS